MLENTEKIIKVIDSEITLYFFMNDFSLKNNPKKSFSQQQLEYAEQIDVLIAEIPYKTGKINLVTYIMTLVKIAALCVIALNHAMKES